MRLKNLIFMSFYLDFKVHIKFSYWKTYEFL